VFNSNAGPAIGLSKLSVGAEASIRTTDAGSSGLVLGMPVEVKNAGSIEGEDFGIKASSFGATTAKGFTITNTVGAEIRGDVAIHNDDANLLMTVKNQGLIGGTFTGIEWMGAINITNSGIINGDLIALNAASTFAAVITNSGFLGQITLSDGNDVIKNSGSTFGALDMRGGDDKLTNSGKITGDLDFGLGNDVVTNTKTITGNVQLGEGNNTLTSSGTITGWVKMGAGDDVIKSTGSLDYVELGAGNDTFVGGNSDDIVFDDLGNDKYALGGGWDKLYLSSGNDTCDGGAGVDTVGFNVGGAVPCLINLDSKDVTLGAQMLQKNLVFSATAGISSTVKNFERANGGSGDDFIAGTSGVNLLNGNGGNDTLYGGLGADRFQDLNGNDTYVYLSIKDSGLTEATRDFISFFAGAGGGDKIDLHAIDADTKSVGNQDFNWITVNANFTKTAGDLRAVFRDDDTYVQGDVNGDGKADFEIVVSGIQFLNAGDFVV